MLDKEEIQKHKLTSDGRPFYESFIELPNGQFFILFCSPDDLIRLANASRWYFDGTFKIQPTLFSQLFTVHTQEGNAIMPCAYALLSHKSYDLYVSFFMHLTNLARTFSGHFHLEEVTCDFETGFLPAISQAFGAHIRVKGCLFHHNQCILRWVKNNGFQQQYASKKSSVRQYIRKFLALPLLPLNLIRSAVQQLVAECLASCPQIENFVTYFNSTWMVSIPPEKWCVHGEFVRTNNAVEGKTLLI